MRNRHCTLRMLTALLALTLPAWPEAVARTAPVPSAPAYTALDIRSGLGRFHAATPGAVWIATGQGQLVRLDPATNRVVASIPVGEVGSGYGGFNPVAVVSDGQRVWAVSDRSLVEIDPQTNRVGRRIELPDVLYTALLDGDTIWASAYDDGRVYRVDLKSGKVVAALSPGGVVSLAAGEGAIWAVLLEANDVLRIDPATNQVAATIPINDSTVGGFVTVAHGSVWATTVRGNQVTRIDPRTNRVVAEIPLEQSAFGITALGGSVWVGTVAFGPEGVRPETGEVVRIDPRTNRIVGRVRVPDPKGMVVHGDTLWMGCRPKPDTVARYVCRLDVK